MPFVKYTGDHMDDNTEWNEPRYAYWAYGSNLNLRQMQTRCPSSQPMGRYSRKGFKLEFRGNGVANVSKVKNAGRVQGAIYLISAADLYFLDTCEGYNPRRPVTSKYIRYKFRSKVYGTVYYYRMNFGYAIRKPQADYIDRIRQGYREWGLNDELLESAVTDAIEYENRLRKQIRGTRIYRNDGLAFNPFDCTDDLSEDLFIAPHANLIHPDEELPHEDISDADYWNTLTDEFNSTNNYILTQEIEENAVRTVTGEYREAESERKPRPTAGRRQTENQPNSEQARTPAPHGGNEAKDSGAHAGIPRSPQEDSELDDPFSDIAL